MRCCLLSILLLILVANPALTLVVRVDCNGGGDYLTIQEGVDAASEVDTLLVAPCTYTGLGNIEVDFGGTNIVLVGTAGADSTIIDCQGEGRGFTLISEEDSTSVISGLTITGGLGGYGGGMWLRFSSPTLHDVVFSDNQALVGGGLCCHWGSSPKMSDCVFSGNIGNSGGGMWCSDSSDARMVGGTFTGNSAQSGGAMDCAYASPRLTDVVLVGNTAAGDGGGAHMQHYSAIFTACSFSANSAGGNGGALACSESSEPEIIDCDFSGNSATLDGGALFCDESEPTITSSFFEGNSARDGGGIYSRRQTIGSTPTLENVTFTANWAERDGGGMFCGLDAYSELVRVTFSGNTAASRGGGMACVDSRPTLTDVVFSGNEAADGAGMYVEGGQYVYANVTRATFFENVASTRGGGFTSADSSPEIANATFYRNHAPDGSHVYSDSSSVELSRSILSFGEGGDALSSVGATEPVLTGCGIFGNETGDSLSCVGVDGNFVADPLFCDAPGGDCHLATNSPCAAESSPSGELVGAHGVACAEFPNFIWIAERAPTDTGIVQVLHASGIHLAAVSAGLNLQGIAWSPDNHVWATSHDSHEVLLLNPEGELLGTFPVGGPPRGIILDRAGNVWTANTTANTVTKLRADGTYVGSFPVGSNPQRLAAGIDGIWVANMDSNNVTKLDTLGAVMGTYIGGGAPMDIAVDHTNNVWVALQQGGNVTKLARNGTFLGNYPVGTAPCHLAVDLNNRVWVANHGSHSVVCLDQTGAIVETITLSPAAAPCALAIDLNQRLWILDDAQQLVHAYTLSGDPLGSDALMHTPTDLTIGGACPSTSVPVESRPDGASRELAIRIDPNPASNGTSLNYTVPSPGARVRIQIFDASGRSVDTIEDSFRPAGDYSSSWDCTDHTGREVSSGVYLCRATVDDRMGNVKLVVVR